MERGGAAAVPFEDPHGISKGAQGACALFGPP